MATLCVLVATMIERPPTVAVPAGSQAIVAAEPAPASSAQPTADGGGRTVVVWISVDGMRGDYVDSKQLPFFARLMKSGAYSRKLLPVFPPLTFPAHVSQATGASVNRHGIIANSLYDLRNDRQWRYPNVASEILCEPIWTTAKRQGRRVLVYDWPVSQQQTGANRADYFDQSFDTRLSDQQRLDRLIDTWSSDQNEEPLQLLMGYVSAPDKAGHKYGPNAAETKAAVQAVDGLLANFVERCEQVFSQKMKDTDRLIFLLSTDHGMEEVKVLLNLQLMCGSAWNDELRLLPGASVAHVFLERLGPPPVRKVHVEALLEKLKAYPFAHAYARENLPEEWAYHHPTRTGDVVVSLDAGYMFSEKKGPLRQEIDATRGPLGMHGYPVERSANMRGFLAIWQAGKSLGGQDLGEIDSRRLHATVAKWLGIEPAEGAVRDVVEIKAEPL